MSFEWNRVTLDPPMHCNPRLDLDVKKKLHRIVDLVSLKKNIAITCLASPKGSVVIPI